MTNKPEPAKESLFATVQGIERDNGLSDLGSIGPYQLLRELGRGGMGAVYLARHANLQRTLAIKVLPAEFANSPDRLERFRREMAAIGRLEHPNIVLATDAGETDGQAFIAMQFLDGKDVSAVLKANPKLLIADACEIVRQAAIGLQHVFRSGLVHRDIKPSNLFLTRHGEIKILDLGLAMLRENDGLSAVVTAPNTIMGTPDFIAPEQINASHQVDIRADIYSLGCTLYALLAGKAPFEGEQYSTTTSKLVAHAEKQAASLKSIRPEVPEAILQIVERMMAKSPDARYAEPQAVADALKEWSVGANLVSLADPNAKATVPDHMPVTNSTNRYRLVVAGVLCAIGAVALAILMWPSNRSPNTVSKSSDSQASGNIETPTTPTNPTPSATASDSTTTPTAPMQASLDTSLQQIAKSAQAIETSNQGVEENTRKMAQSFDELVKQLSSSQTSKPLSDPKTPGEHYYNALVYSMQGNARMARQAFLAYFALNQDYIDPHLKFIETLTLQEGKASARELYKSLSGDRELLSRRLAEATLLDTEARQTALEALTTANENFAPAWCALSGLYSGNSPGQQTLREAVQEMNCLKRCLSAHEQGGLLKYYLDPSEAATVLTRAEMRLKALEQIDQDRMRQPVSLMMAMKIGENWQASVEIAEPAKELFYRVGETGDFQSLGKSIGTDPATGFPLVKKSFTIPGSVQKTSLFLQYKDMKDQMCGPYTLPFDAQEQTKKWETYAIQQMKPNWLRLMEDRIFFDIFHAGRSVLKEVRYGVDVEKPNKQKAVPRAELSGENASDYNEAVSPSAKYVVVQIVFTDGTESEVVRIERR